MRFRLTTRFDDLGWPWTL